jgi:hypothetical protein
MIRFIGRQGGNMGNQEFDFESEYASDSEIEEAMDSLVISVANDIAQDESRTSIINPYRMQHLLYTYKVMKYLMKGTSAKVTYNLHEPYQSIGSVSVTGKDIEFKKVSWFIRAAELASNYEVYPKTDGTVCMTFTFHCITTPIE